MKKYVAYYRESSKKQVSRRQAAEFGLQSRAGADEEHWGLDSQRIEVQRHISATGGTLIAEYIEAESGRKINRPKLKEALNHVKLSGAVLIVAKLERLARNVAFLSALMESKVEFICCDIPGATPLTLHLLVSVAEDEVRRTSTRTRDGLAVAKAAGVKLGASNPVHAEKCGDNWRGFKQGSAAAAAARQARTKEFRDAIKPHIDSMQREGKKTLQQIADGLNSKGFRTQALKLWSRASVCNLFRDFESRQTPAESRGKSLLPEIVAELKTRYAAGEKCTDLARWLNSKGLRTTRGNEWDVASVYSKVNCGKNPVGK